MKYSDLDRWRPRSGPVGGSLGAVLQQRHSRLDLPGLTQDREDIALPQAEQEAPGKFRALIEFSREFSRVQVDGLHVRGEWAEENPEFVKNSPYRCAAHKRNNEPSLDDPEQWATTWRAYLRKQRQAQ